MTLIDLPARLISQPARTIAQHARTIAQHARTIALPGRTIAQHARTIALPGRTIAQPARTIAQSGRTIAQGNLAAGQSTTVPDSDKTPPDEVNRRGKAVSSTHPTTLQTRRSRLSRRISAEKPLGQAQAGQDRMQCRALRYAQRQDGVVRSIWPRSSCRFVRGLTPIILQR